MFNVNWCFLCCFASCCSLQDSYTSYASSQLWFWFVITVFQRQIKPNSFFFPCMHSSAKINSLLLGICSCPFVPCPLHLLSVYQTQASCLVFRNLFHSLSSLYSMCCQEADSGISASITANLCCLLFLVLPTSIILWCAVLHNLRRQCLQHSFFISFCKTPPWCDF